MFDKFDRPGTVYDDAVLILNGFLEKFIESTER